MAGRAHAEPENVGCLLGLIEVGKFWQLVPQREAFSSVGHLWRVFDLAAATLVRWLLLVLFFGREAESGYLQTDGPSIRKAIKRTWEKDDEEEIHFSHNVVCAHLKMTL